MSVQNKLSVVVIFLQALKRDSDIYKRKQNKLFAATSSITGKNPNQEIRLLHALTDARLCVRLTGQSQAQKNKKPCWNKTVIYHQHTFIQNLYSSSTKTGEKQIISFH